MTRGFALALVVGSVFMGVGVSIAWMEPDRVQPRAFVLWLLGAAVIHDLFVVPLGLAFAWAVRRAVGRRPSALAFLGAAAALVVVVGSTFPIWRAYGRSPGNPSLLPFDYRWGVAVAAGAIVVAMLAALLWAQRGGSGERRPGH